MKEISTGQARAYFALACILTVGMLIVFFMVSLILGILMLFVAVGVLCWIKLKHPQVFETLKKKPPEPLSPINPGPGVSRDGFKASIVLVYNTGISTKHISVDKPIFTLGRSDGCDLTLTGDTDISRNHATIEHDPRTGKSRIRDNRSHNGTRVNGELLRAGEARELRNNDQIQIGDRTITVQQKYY